MKKFKDWAFQWMQVITLIILAIIPLIFDFASIIRSIFEEKTVDFDTVKYYWLMKLGNGVIGIALMLVFLFTILRVYNNKKLLNKGQLYHDHFYIGYLFCAKVLGYKKCSLVRVPIPMQVKLIIRDTFDEYDYGEDIDYKNFENENITVEGPVGDYTSTINLVLSDTYPITRGMLPASTSNLSTVWVLRDNKENATRVYSSKFYEEVRNIVQKLPSNVYRINLYSTLNPKHCWWITRNVFKQGGRSNIRALTVFPQPYKNGNWNFSEVGALVFDEK